MDRLICPGAKALRQPKPEDKTCPHCGAEVEIWTDEIKGLCPSCRKTVMKDGTMSCLEWCELGKACVGDNVYDTYMKNRAITIKEKLLEELEAWFDTDKKRIKHAKDVLALAEEILLSEDADWHIVIPASILHDVGIKIAEKKYDSSHGKYQELEGPPVAKKIMLKLGVQKEAIDEICDIIAHHHSPGILETNNFKVLYDADSLVNIREIIVKKSSPELRKIIDKRFLTKSGKRLAEERYLQ